MTPEQLNAHLWIYALPGSEQPWLLQELSRGQSIHQLNKAHRCETWRQWVNAPSAVTAQRKVFHSISNCSMSFLHSGLQLLISKTDIHEGASASRCLWCTRVVTSYTAWTDPREVTGTGTAGSWTYKTCNTNPSFCPCPPLWQSSRQPRCLQRIAHSGQVGAPTPGWAVLHVPPPSQTRPPEPRGRWLSPRQLQRSISLQSASHQASLIKPLEGKEIKGAKSR